MPAVFEGMVLRKMYERHLVKVVDGTDHVHTVKGVDEAIATMLEGVDGLELECGLMRGEVGEGELEILFLVVGFLEGT